MSAEHSIPCNIAAPLATVAESRPHALAVVYPEGRNRTGRIRYTHFTYRQLHEESDRLAHGLARIGLVRGMRTVLMVKPSLEFFALTFALFKLGAVPVFIDPGMGIRNLGRCLTEAEPEAFIGIPTAHVARIFFGWGRRTLRHWISVGPRLWPGGLSLAQIRRCGRGAGSFPMVSPPADEIAAILFTSGSTGPPKGAVYTHGIFTAQVESLRQTFGIQPGEIDLCTFPLFALFAPALGMTAIVPEMDATRPGQVDPRKIIEAIDDFGATNLFGSPALLNRVGNYCRERGVRFSSLRRVISAGAPVSARILACWENLLEPSVQVFTPYGATEALPVCAIGSKEILSETAARTAEGAGVCIGRTLPGLRLGIIRITDEPISIWSDELPVLPGEIGEIAVQGPIATRAYYRRPEDTALAKIDDPANGSFYHRMGDLGYLDEYGRVWFCGRKSQRVVTETGTLFTISCEAVFNQHPEVARTALVGVGQQGHARPVVCVELQADAAANWPRIEEELRSLGAARPHTRAIDTFLRYPRPFPVDIRHNAKIFREKLAAWAARQLARNPKSEIRNPKSES
jgi:acyl-CoA synthetase (AMP-forming)/AMP-acid ligase II